MSAPILKSAKRGSRKIDKRGMKKHWVLVTFHNILQYRQHSTFVKFFAVFFLLMTIPVVSTSFYSAYRTRTVIRDDSTAAYSQLLTNFSETTNMELSFINKCANEIIVYSPYILLKNATHIDSETTIPVFDMLKEIKKLSQLFDLVDSTFVYFSRMDRILFQNCGYIVSKFVDEYLGGNKELLTGEYYNYDIRLSEGAGTPSLLLIHTPNAFSDIRPPATQIIFIIRISTIEEYLSKISIHKNANILLLSNDGNVLASIGDIVIGLSGYELSGISGGASVVHDGIKYFTAITRENAHGLILVAMVPEEEFYAPSNFIYHTVLITVILIFLIAIIISFIMSVIFYRPISAITSSILNSDLATGHTGSSELYSLANSYFTLLSEKDALRERADISERSMKENIAYHLITGFTSPDMEPSLINEKAKSFFINNRFKVVAMRVDNRPDIDAHNLALVCSTIHNICYSLTDVLSTQIHRQEIIVITGVPADDSVYIELFIESFRTLIQKTCPGFSCWFGVSDTFSDITKLHTGNKQAQSALQYRDEVMDFQIIYYGQTKNVINVYFPLEKEQIIYNSLLAGDITTAINNVNEVYLNNTERHIPYYLFQRLFDIYYLILQRVMNVLQPVLFNLHDIAEISPDETPREQIKRIERLCHEICGYTYTTMDHKFNEIKSYINDHLDKDISLDLLSGIFDLSSGYISRKFKETNNVSFVVYINKSRVKLAKELLVSTNGSMQAIAAKTGFLSASTFARTFRQYEGVSPSEYRIIHKSKHS